MGRANSINTMYDSTLSTIYTMYNRPHNTEMTDGYTFNPLLQAENTLLGILQQTQKRLIFLSSNIRFVISMFKRVEPPLGEVTVTNQGHWGSCHHFGIHPPPNMEWENKYEINYDYTISILSIKHWNIFNFNPALIRVWYLLFGTQSASLFSFKFPW